MKKRILIVAGGALLLVCLAVGAYRLASHSQGTTVRFVGYVDDGHHGWLAVFRATNSAPSEVTCEPWFQQGSNSPPLMRSGPEFLKPRTGANWIYPVADTNLACRLQIRCYEMPPPLVDRWNHLVAEAFPSIAKSHWLMIPGRRFAVTCAAEAP